MEGYQCRSHGLDNELTPSAERGELLQVLAHVLGRESLEHGLDNLGGVGRWEVDWTSVSTTPQGQGYALTRLKRAKGSLRAKVLRVRASGCVSAPVPHTLTYSTYMSMNLTPWAFIWIY
jgi:hypothetical protein